MNGVTEDLEAVGRGGKHNQNILYKIFLIKKELEANTPFKATLFMITEGWKGTSGWLADRSLSGWI